MFYTKLFRGWIYFILGSVMVLLTAWMVTNAKRPNPGPDGSVSSETSTPSEESAEPPATADAAETPLMENETETKPGEQVTSGEDVATQTPAPTQPTDPPGQNPPMSTGPENAKVAETTQDPAPAADQAKIQPAANQPQPAADPTPAPSTPVVTRINCDYLISPPPPETGFNDGYAWSVSAETPMHAVFSGTIVKISESPYTGTTVYQVNETGTWCAVYGGVGELLVTEGDIAPCGSRIGLATEKVYLSALTLKPGEDWWRGKPASVKALFK